MAECASERVRKLLKPVIELLGGIPSVVYGFFGLTVIVPLLQRVFNLPVGESGLAGSIVLAIMALPTIITVSEDALRSCPRAMREASLALGATKFQTIWKVLLPMSMPRVMTGLILSLGRVSGETAPILFTCAAYFLPKLPHSIFDQCMALPYHLYVVATSGTDIDAQLPIAYGTAFVLIVIVLLMNLTAGAIRRHFEKHS